MQVIRVTLSIPGEQHCHIGNRMFVAERLVFVPPPVSSSSSSSFSISIDSQKDHSGSVFESDDTLVIRPDFGSKSGGRQWKES